jgi:hypothetical protein
MSDAPAPDDPSPDGPDGSDGPSATARAPRSDPLETLTPRRLRAAARKAELLRRRGGDLGEMAAGLGIDERRLRLLADAWREAGASGIDALGPAVPTPASVAEHVDDALERWRGRHYPLELLRWETWRNRVTVWRLLPSTDRTGPVDRIPLLQLRLTHEGRWHLYRKASRGEWWPVTVRGAGKHQSLEQCLEAVRNDPGNRFWTAGPAMESLWEEPSAPKDTGPGGA